MGTLKQVLVYDVSADTAEGETARLIDPLWVLARQWQMGELQGEDNGSPVQASMTAEASLLGCWQAGPAGSTAPVQTLSSQVRHLEAIVEGETWHTGGAPHFRLAAEKGLALQGLLQSGGLVSALSLLKGRVLLQAPVEGPITDAASARCVRMMAGRTIDGLALWRSLAPLHAAQPSRLSEVFTGQLASCTDPVDAVLAVLSAWLDGWQALLPDRIDTASTIGPSPAWVSERQEYAFSLGAKLEAGDITLSAPSFLGGHADWHAFVQDPSVELGHAPASARKTLAFIPTPVQFRGMPQPRFWEFEDGRVNLPLLKHSDSRQDPASQLFLDFALRYSNDWFSLPLPLPIGSVSRLHELTVLNTFGERFRLPHARTADAAAGRLFALSAVPSDPATRLDAARMARHADVFLLPLSADASLDGAPVEQVRLVRDELANLAWAIETVVESAAGLRVDRIEQAGRERLATPPADLSTLPRYRLGTEVPPFWIPLVPEAGHRLRRAAAPRFTDAGMLPLPPWGRVLEPGGHLVLHDEEVPREGARITRRYRFARSIDGHALLWMARQKGAGQGEASSGLRFDVVEPLSPI